jgi:hypothetical protein
VEKALVEYRKDPSTVLEDLYDFIVLQRAKAMCEKLYVGCSKAYLFSLENGLMGLDEGDSVKTDALEDLPKRVKQAIPDECNRVGIGPVDNM